MKKKLSPNTTELIRTLNHYVDYRSLLNKWGDGYTFCDTYATSIHATNTTLIKLSKELDVPMEYVQDNGGYKEYQIEYDGLRIFALLSTEEQIKYNLKGEK